MDRDRQTYSSAVSFDVSDVRPSGDSGEDELTVVPFAHDFSLLRESVRRGLGAHGPRMSIDWLWVASRKSGIVASSKTCAAIVWWSTVSPLGAIPPMISATPASRAARWRISADSGRFI